MRSLRLTFTVSIFLFGCSGPVTDDVLPDSGGKDSSVADSGKTDAGGKDASMDSTNDGSSMDAMDDAMDGSVVGDAQALDGGIASLTGLALWLDAAKGLTKNNQNQVSKWADQSSNGNDASQGTQAMQPVYNGSVINGFPALHFDKSNKQVLEIVDSNSLKWGTGDFLIEIVSRFDNNPNNQEFGMFYVKADMTSGIVVIANDAVNNGAGLAAGIDGNDLLGVTKAYNDNAARCYAFRRTGNTLELRVNGQQVAMKTQGSAIDVSASGVNATIGDYQGSTPLDGDIAEIVAVKGATSSQDLTSLEAFLMSKYNL